MPKPLIILGAGGHAKVVADIATAAGWRVVGFADTEALMVGTTVVGDLKVIASQDELLARDVLPYAVTFAFGANAGRLKLLALFAAANTPVLVHPSATVSPSATLGAATHVAPQVVIHPLAVVGEAVILNTGCIIEHDCRIGDGVHVSPGAVLAGNVTVGACTWIGANATVINNVSVGADVIVGAGAVVVRDIPSGVTVVGNPARIIKRSP